MKACIALGHVVIAVSRFNLPYAGVAPHPQSILRRLESSKHFGEKLASGGAKKSTVSFLSFFCAICLD